MSPNKHLLLETRWTRFYSIPGLSGHIVQSRFMDGTASVTLAELTELWHSWQESDKMDFCQSFRSAKVPERQDILRFVITQGDHPIWRIVALTIALEFPPQEAISLLINWCQTCRSGESANYYQALASINDPKVPDILASCFIQAWELKQLDNEVNSAVDAVYCLHYLIKLGSDPASQSKAYQLLKNHPLERVRNLATQLLKDFFEPNPE